MCNDATEQKDDYCDEVFRLDGSMLTTAMQEKDLVLQAVLLQRSARLQ